MGNNIVNYCIDGPQCGCRCDSCKEELQLGVPKGLAPSGTRSSYVKRIHWDEYKNKPKVQEIQKLNPDFVPVYINVYNKFHLAVEVGDREISYNTHGRIYHQKAKTDEGKDYWYQVLVGFTLLSWDAIVQIIEEWQRVEFREGEYSLLGKNCRNFSVKFAQCLLESGDQGRNGFTFIDRNHMIL